VQNFTNSRIGRFFVCCLRFLARGYRALVLNSQVFGAINYLNSALAAGATLFACAFALSTFDRWHRRGQPQELAWTIAMILFALGSAALWWAESTGWSMITFRVFFLAGAVLNVPWLALGTVYLLTNRGVADRLRDLLVVLSAFSVGVISVAPTKKSMQPGEFPTARELFGILPRTMAAIGSGIPALVIIVGALWSTWRVVRAKSPSFMSSNPRIVSSPRRLATGNILIAVGTLVLSASGSLGGRLGKDRAFAVTLLTGLVVLFLGFLIASNSTRNERKLSSDD